MECKRIPTQLNTLQEGDSSIPSVTQPAKELYGSQLAQLLRTARKHSFHILHFNSHAYNSADTQYAFLFNYPPSISSHRSKILNHLILSGEDDSGFKLELKQRFHIAQILAHTIGAFHSDSWLYKNARAQAVRFFFHKNG